MIRTQTVILDEWQLTFRVPADLPDPDVDAIRRVLDDAAFAARLRRAMAAVLAAFPELVACRVTVSR